MKVICAGQMKTGTKSMCTALRILGLTVYDFEEQAWYIGNELKKALDVGCSKEEYRRMLAGVDAVTDTPCCILWEEISAAFPDAKIMICKRADEEAWLKSILNQADKVREKPILRFLLMLSYTGLWLQEYGNSFMRVGFGQNGSKPWRRQTLNGQTLLLRYRQHNSHIYQTVPKKKLLDFNLADGWEPLCKFLDLPVPKEEFPFRNKGGVIVDELIEDSLIFTQIKKECLVSLTVIFAIIAYIIYSFWM